MELLVTQLFLQPVLAGDETLNNIADNIVAGSIDHGCGGIHQVAQGNGDGVSDGHLVGEEDGAQHQLTGTAAAGDTGHGNGGEHSYDDSQDGFTGAEVLAEDTEQERDLDNSGHCTAVHVHGSTQGQDNVGDILRDAGFFSSFHIGGDSSNRGASAEGNSSGLEQLAEHDLCSTLAAAKAGIDGEEHEHVSEAQHVVDDQRAAVVADQLGTVGSDQISKEAEEADGCVVGDQLDNLHDALGQVSQQLCGHGLLAASHLDAEAAQNCEDDQRQDCPAAPQLNEVRLGEEVDDHISKAQGLTNFTGGCFVLTLNQGEDTANNVHEERGDAGSYQEGSNGGAHDLTGFLGAVHVSNRGSDGTENHGDNDTEHQVNEHSAQGLQAGCAGPNSTGNAAGNDAQQHKENKRIVFQEIFHWGKPPFRF